MARLNSRQRDDLWNTVCFSGQTHGEYCRGCGVPVSKSRNSTYPQGIIDHIDNDNNNNHLSNLQILCRSCNEIKNPRGFVTSMNRTGMTRAETTNERAEPQFRKWIFRIISDKSSVSFEDLQNGGAQKFGISPITAERYLNKLTSITGSLEIIEGYVQWASDETMAAREKFA